MVDTVKHTPGPWKLLTDGDRNRLCPADQNNHSILTLEDEGNSTFACVYEEADAHLIAAAPDILKVLKRIDAAMDFDGTCHPLFNGLQKQMQDAIAKAEGRS